MTKHVRSGAAALGILAVLAVLSLGGCGSDSAPQQNYMPVTYLEIAANDKPLILNTQLSGFTTAYNISEVRPQITGILQQRLFEQGDQVAEGQPLYQIDPALYQAAVDSAAANLQKAQANAQAAGLLARRYKEIVGSKAVSRQDYDNAVAAFAQAQADVGFAKAALDTARINLGYTRLTAPISGRIGRSAFTSGALVTQNQPQALATIQQLDPIYVDVTQSGTDLLRLRKAYDSGLLKSSGKNAAKVKLILPDGSLYEKADEQGKMQPVEGDLLFSEVSVEQSTGTVTLRAEFPNPSGVLLPGMFVRAVVEEGAREGAILVPQKAVSRDNRGRPVVRMLAKNATIQDMEGIYNVLTVPLVLDRDVDGNKWLVVDGLKAGDKILTDGLLKLQAGKPVRALPPEGAAPGAGAGTAADGKKQ